MYQQRHTGLRTLTTLSLATTRLVGPTLGSGTGCTGTRTVPPSLRTCASRKSSWEHSGTTRCTRKGGSDCGYSSPIFPWLAAGLLGSVVFCYNLLYMYVGFFLLLNLNIYVFFQQDFFTLNFIQVDRSQIYVKKLL